MNRYKLGDIAELQTGPFGSQLHEEDYVDCGTPIVTVEHLGDIGFTTQNLPFVSEDDAKRLSRYSLKEGDIVFSRVGSIDRCVYVKKEQEGWLFSGRCLRVRCDRTKINPRFLSYYFKLPSFKRMMLDISVGATMPSLNTELMKSLDLLIVDNDAQDEIANTLDCIDSIIENNNKIYHELESLAKMIFDYWFLQFCFPNDEGKPYKSSGGEMVWNDKLKMEIPLHWQVKNIRDIASITWGQCPDGKNILGKLSVGDNLFDYCSGAGDMKGGFLVDCQAKTDASKRLAHKGDILMSVAGKIGDMCVVDHTISLGRAAMAYTAKEGHEMPYIYLILKSMNKKICAISSGSIQKIINNDNISDINFAYSHDVVYKFGKISSEIFSKMMELSLESRSLASLRDYLLPLFMNDQVRF